jgi:hypothetical protein
MPAYIAIAAADLFGTRGIAMRLIVILSLLLAPLAASAATTSPAVRLDHLLAQTKTLTARFT